MGSVIRARCNCIFEKEIYLASGFDNFDTYFNFPMFCPECKTLFEGDLYSKTTICPNCKSMHGIPYDSDQLCHKRGQVVFVCNTDERIGRQLRLTEGDYLCPQCGRFTMTFEDVGEWD